MNRPGYTLIEIMVAMSVGVSLLAVLLSIYVLANQSLIDSTNRSELTQNSRTIIERLTRDVRQAKSISTALPASGDDPLLLPPAEIMVEDGHNTEILQYIRYYLDDTDIRRQILRYSFASAPTVFVTWNAEDDYGNLPIKTEVEDSLVGEYVSSLKFWGTGIITVEMNLSNRETIHSTKAELYGRNL